MDVPITQHMKFILGDAISGFLGFDKEDVHFCNETLMVGYVSGLDESGFPSQFKFLDIDIIDISLDPDKQNEMVEVNQVECFYEGMTTLATDDGLGTYPTYILNSSSGKPVKLFIKYVTRSE